MEIRVRVKADAKNDRIKRNGDGYDISVRAPAAGGMANASVRALLSRELGIPFARLRIVRGLRSPSKSVRVDP